MRSSSRQNQWFRHWQQFVVQLYGNGGQVPTLDWRGCIAIYFVRREHVAFCVSYELARGRNTSGDETGSFFFSGREARRVFNRYFALKQRFIGSARPESARAKHLQPATWTGRRIHSWTRPFEPEDIALAIASLVAYWDSCAAKPSALAGSDETGRKGAKEEAAFWDLKPLPRLMRMQGLPARLARELKKHAKAMPNPMHRADPPVEMF
jgi:hypothetical protein